MPTKECLYCWMLTRELGRGRYGAVMMKVEYLERTDVMRSTIMANDSCRSPSIVSWLSPTLFSAHARAENRIRTTAPARRTVSRSTTFLPDKPIDLEYMMSKSFLSLRHQLRLTQTTTSYTSRSALLVTLHPTDNRQRRREADISTGSFCPTEIVASE